MVIPRKAPELFEDPDAPDPRGPALRRVAKDVERQLLKLEVFDTGGIEVASKCCLSSTP